MEVKEKEDVRCGDEERDGTEEPLVSGVGEVEFGDDVIGGDVPDFWDAGVEFGRTGLEFDAGYGVEGFGQADGKWRLWSKVIDLQG